MKEGMGYHLRPLAATLILLVGCSSDDPPTPDDSLLLRQGEALAVDLVLPKGSGAGLIHAAEDLMNAMTAIAGASEASAPILGGLSQATRPLVVEVAIDPDGDQALGQEGYSITQGELGQGKRGIRVAALTERGGMYGLYRIASDLGVRYYHPEETYYPQDPEATLPWEYSGAVESPSFARRGFHEHTQHPTVMSDYLLRPNNDAFRQGLSRYLRWMARNRQNVLFFHMLKTVDLEAWVPYISDVIAEAKDHGVGLGLVIGFADQQQNAFKMIRDDALDPETGEVLAEEVQIGQALDALMPAGFEYVGFQIGTSEFTKPDEDKPLAWLQAALDHLGDNYPDVQPYAWIHITCSLLNEDGSYYYHLPLQADGRLGAYVHTTMFYTLDHAAPVYDCEDFGHQREFMERASGERELVFFPETAWWLGFDNNTPLILPITGFSREYDIAQVLGQYEVSGHVTFTTGREWTYWQYDHFLTQITWDDQVTWEDYLDWLAPAYGEGGDDVARVLKAWTALQVKHLYNENPLIYFYLAGELTQDEIGQQAGILARRPKLAFDKVLAFDDDELAAWRASDYDMLVSMLAEHQELLDTLPDEPASATDGQTRLYREVANALLVYVRRLEHTIALYSGVVEAREGDLDGAQEQLDLARGISQEVIELFQEMEAIYRYPLELLCREKAESPTSYPYGYLYETSTGYFWTRRDDQLEGLIAMVSGTMEEAWGLVPDEVYLATSDSITLTEPQNPLAAGVIASFIPQLLFGLEGYDAQAGTMNLVLAQDANENLLPDGGTEAVLEGLVAEGLWEGACQSYTIIIRDSVGLEMGALPILEPVIRLTLEEGVIATGGELLGEMASGDLVAMVVSVGGIDEDGVTELVKAIYGLPYDQPLPERLPFQFVMTLQRD